MSVMVKKEHSTFLSMDVAMFCHTASETHAHINDEIKNQRFLGIFPTLEYCSPKIKSIKHFAFW